MSDLLIPTLENRPEQRALFHVPLVWKNDKKRAAKRSAWGRTEKGGRTERDVKLGAAVLYEQTRVFEGMALGSLLHSVALAPGEATRIAVIDWARDDVISGLEDTRQTESLTATNQRHLAQNDISTIVANTLPRGQTTQSATSDVSATGKSGPSRMNFATAAVAYTGVPVQEAKSTPGWSVVCFVNGSVRVP